MCWLCSGHSGLGNAFLYQTIGLQVKGGTATDAANRGGTFGESKSRQWWFGSFAAGCGGKFQFSMCFSLTKWDNYVNYDANNDGDDDVDDDNEGASFFFLLISNNCFLFCLRFSFWFCFCFVLFRFTFRYVTLSFFQLNILLFLYLIYIVYTVSRAVPYLTICPTNKIPSTHSVCFRMPF